jgi:predicted dienelactone hydrolase
MNRCVSLGILGIIMLLLFACSPSPATMPDATVAKPQNTPTKRVNTPTPTTAQPTPTIVLQDTQEPSFFALSEPGPYFPGNRTLTLVDESRDGREVRVKIVYPAIKENDANGNLITYNAEADMSGAPYPLILTGTNSGYRLFQDHLATHGFVMAIVSFPDFSYEDDWGFYVIDNPRDILFALDQISSNPPQGLEGVVDTDHAGVAGYSSDGLFSLALSGVRIDPEFYLSHCEQGPIIEAAYGAEWYHKYTCSLAQKWDEFAAYVGDEITTSNDGLWQPVTDERIRAVMPMAPDGAWLYGERGLALVDRPVLMIAATEDEFIPYQSVIVDIFEHLGAPDKSMISLIGKTHMDVEDPEVIKRIRHFATAFFGYHLQGHQEYKEFFSEDFVSQFEDLYWGVYPGD